MSIRVRDGVMVALAAGGVLALAGTAEFGIPAAIIGAGMSALSGALAVQRPDEKPKPHVRLLTTGNGSHCKAIQK